MKILHLDSNHPLLINQLNDLGYTNHQDYTSSKTEVEKKIGNYDGISSEVGLKLTVSLLMLQII